MILTVNSFNSVSLDPPLVLWSLGNSAQSMAHFKSAEYFAVHILSRDQETLSTTFAKRGVDKFAGLEITRGPEDIPLLGQCAARFICRTTYQYEGGDHTIFVGEVVEFSHWDRPPLLFHAGQYGQILKNEPSTTSGMARELKGDSLGFLLRECGHRLLYQLKGELSKHGLTVAQYYFLALVAKYGGGTLESLCESTRRGDSAASQSEIDELENRGYLEQQNGTIQLTTKGSRLHVELAAFYKAAEEKALGVLDDEMRQALHIALSRLLNALSDGE